MITQTKLHFLTLLIIAFGLVACDDDRVDVTPTPVEPEPALNGAIFTQTNQDQNAVVFYERADDGRLSLVGTYATGGSGTNINEPDAPGFNDPLGSQGAVAVSPDRAFVFAVNAGDNTVTSFRIFPDRLERVSTVSTGGVTPISVAATNDYLYVVNNGDGGSAQGFDLADDGTLTALNNSNLNFGRGGDPLGAAAISVSPDGDHVVVTTKPDSKLLVLDTDNGRLTEFTEIESTGMTPFGSQFIDDNTLLVSEAFGGDSLAGAISSYDLDNNQVRTVSSSVPTNQTASCWVVTSPSGRYAYTSNTPAGTITTFRLDSNSGALTTTTNSGVSGTVPNPEGSFVLDMATTEGEFLYVVVNTNSQIVPFQIDGINLNLIADGVITDTNLLPEGRVTGLAGF